VRRGQASIKPTAPYQVGVDASEGQVIGKTHHPVVKSTENHPGYADPNLTARTASAQSQINLSDLGQAGRSAVQSFGDRHRCSGGEAGRWHVDVHALGLGDLVCLVPDPDCSWEFARAFVEGTPSRTVGGIALAGVPIDVLGRAPVLDQDRPPQSGHHLVTEETGLGVSRQLGEHRWHRGDPVPRRRVARTC